MKDALGWLVFAGVQLVMLAARVVGVVVLIVPCLVHAWRPARSRYGPARMIDEWRWPGLNWWTGNWEDGPSGLHALIWGSGAQAGERVAYLLDPPLTKKHQVVKWLWDAWRAYCWSAWRNSANNLKYFFAWEHGPFVEVTYSFYNQVRTLRLGWQLETGVHVPVLSL
jgi:hypothetical protein